MASLKLLLATLFALFNRSLALDDQEPLMLSADVSIRNATQSDAAAITNIVLSAFKDNPHWRYVYQFQDQYPEEHFECFHRNLYQALAIEGVLAQVALLPNITKPHELTPIAATLWVLPTAWSSFSQGQRLFSSIGMSMMADCEDRDKNSTRWEDFLRQMFDAKAKYLDDILEKKNQIYLDTLATLPDYQRRGAGSALVRSAVALGSVAYKDQNVTATLIATPTGELLYQYLGWESMHNYSVHSLDVVNGTREQWKFDVMKYEL